MLNVLDLLFFSIMAFRPSIWCILYLQIKIISFLIFVWYFHSICLCVQHLALKYI